MDAGAIVRKWAASSRSERSAAQEHFIDLCNMLGEPTPGTDPNGDRYAFEKGAKTAGGDGWADVWLKGHFAWEYKGKLKNLTLAYTQLRRYAEALDNPPLLVVCDLDRFEVHTNWNTETWIYYFRMADLVTDEPVDVRTISGSRAKHAPDLTAMQVLSALFDHPQKLRPEKTREQITQTAAKMFGEISDELRRLGVEEMRIARFITKVMFCMFATDVGLLPKETFSEVIRVHRDSGDVKGFKNYLSRLFKVMNRGGKFAMHDIAQFNGRLFKDVDVPDEIDGSHIHTLARLDDLEWADVEPSVFGTLFERVLDARKRRTLGAHYTSRADIELIVEPVLMEPLRREWRDVKQQIGAYADEGAGRRAKPEARRERVKAMLLPFHRRLYTIQVLDPACGSGNFLYVSLAMLKALEKEVIALAASYEIPLRPRVHPTQLHGIETNEIAHELASIVIWIGYLQWKKNNTPAAAPDTPILSALDQVEGRDAILDLSNPKQPKEATWPAVDVIVGNPPFLGVRIMRGPLGDEYVEKLASVYEGRVDRRSDLCCYWFEKAREAIENGRARRAGLLATQGIRGGANRKVLERIKETGDIFYAQSDREWLQEGVTVHVSMVGFDDGSEMHRLLNESSADDASVALKKARPVEGINANLTYQTDVVQAQRLRENAGVCFQGPVVVGPFYIDPRTAETLLSSPNPHGEPNELVIRPMLNAADITGRSRRWSIIDFGQRTLEEAALFEAPFEYALKHVKPFRENSRDKQRRENWWRHGRAGTEMRAALSGLKRFIATPEVSKWRVFVWVETSTVVTNTVELFARNDDFFFGVLQSRAHEVWALEQGTQLESRPRYTPTTCFETFPFPHGTQEQHWGISIAAKDLDDLRNGWLNPEGMVGAKELAKRTFTNLYNARPTWLANAHRALDKAVFAAYGWRESPADLTDADILGRLLALNLSRDPA